MGIALSGDVGVGVSAGVKLPIKDLVALIIEQALGTPSGIESTPGTIHAFEGGYSTATGGAIIGVEMDLNNPQDKTPTVGLTVGGGVYTGGTIVIEIIDGDGKK